VLSKHFQNLKEERKKERLNLTAVFSFKTKLIGDTIYTLAKVKVIYSLINSV